MSSLRKAFSKDQNVNYIVIDWTEISTDFNYLCVLERVPSVAKCVRDFLVSLRCKISDITSIGHSLGGQVAAEISRGFFHESGEKVKRIIALDAAKPCIRIPNVPYDQKFCEDFLTLFIGIYEDILFPDFNPPLSLHKGDGHFVIGIHSSCLQGIPQPANNKNIYLGNGCSQQVCDLMAAGAVCYHEIVATIFTMFISGERIELYSCETFEDVKRCRCDLQTNVSMYSIEDSDSNHLYQIKSYTVEYNGTSITSNCQALF